MVYSTAAEANMEIPLEHKWDFFLDNGGWATDGDYLSVMKRLGTVGSIQQFWNHHNGMQQSMVKICSQPSLFSLRLFRNDIKPIWEDESNRCGGKWVIPCSTMEPFALWALWQEVLMCAVGGTFARKGAVCGCILSYRKNGRKEIHIWVDRTPADLIGERSFVQELFRFQALPFFRAHDRNCAKVDTRSSCCSVVSEDSDEERARSARTSRSASPTRETIRLSPQTSANSSPSNTPVRLSPQVSPQFGIRVIA